MPPVNSSKRSGESRRYRSTSWTKGLPDCPHKIKTRLFEQKKKGGGGLESARADRRRRRLCSLHREKREKQEYTIEQQRKRFRLLHKSHLFKKRIAS